MIKVESQSFIILARNLVLHICIKQINIQHFYICNEMTSGRINLVYMPSKEILADRVTKPLFYIKFLNSIKQFWMK